MRTVAEVVDRFLVSLSESRQTRSILTGLSALDAITKGVRLSEMTVIAGRPGAGKSTLAFGLMYDMARNGFPALLVSKEMSAEMVVAKELSRQSSIEFDSVLAGASGLKLERLEEEAAKLRALPVWIDTQASSVEHIAQHLAREPSIKLVVVDYVQLLRGTQRDARHQEISEVAYGLHDLCLQGYTVIAVSQMNRNQDYREDKEPRLSDLDGSDGVGKAAENVWMLTHGDEHEGGRMVDVTIAKSRYGQAQRTARLWFMGQFSAFGNVA